MFAPSKRSTFLAAFRTFWVFKCLTIALILAFELDINMTRYFFWDHRLV
jgi:hypothetical protein